MACILQPKCNFLHGFFRCHLPVEMVDVEVKITSMQGIHMFRRDRTCQIIKCNPWSTKHHPHPTLIKKMRIYLELEGKLGPNSKIQSLQNQSRPAQPNTNPLVRREAKATDKRRKLIPTKRYKRDILPSSHGDSALWIGTSDGLTAQVVAVGFKCPMPWAPMNVPLAWALQFLLQLHSWEVGGSAGSNVWDDVILTLGRGRASSRTSALVNVVKSSMVLWSSSTLSAIWWGSPSSSSSWAFSTQYCKAFIYAKVFCSCLMK